MTNFDLALNPYIERDDKNKYSGAKNPMAYCADSFSRSFSHTFRLLFQPFRLFYWIKVSILAFFIQGFSVLSTQSYFHELPNPNELDRLAEEALAVLPTIVGVLIASMFIGIIMHALQACARFLFFDAVREGFISYRSSLQRHFSGIVSLFLWNVIIKNRVFYLYDYRGSRSFDSQCFVGLNGEQYDRNGDRIHD